MNLKDLSPADRKALLQELTNEQKKEKEAREENVTTYKSMIDEMVGKLAPTLAEFGTKQNDIVEATFKDFNVALELKKMIYGAKDGQGSHTFTSRDGNGSITIGYNEVIGFDGTETAGVAKIKAVIESLSSDDDNRRVLADLVNTFMKQDRKGNLNPTRIAELISKKDAVKNPIFSEGVDIIVNAQFKTRTSQYVRGWHRISGENGKETKVQFSITAN